MSDEQKQMAYNIWRLQKWAENYGSYSDIDAAVERGELVPYQDEAQEAGGDRVSNKHDTYLRIAETLGCEATEEVVSLREENEKLRAELAAEAVTQPCGHAAKWLAYRDGTNVKSERYCVFCEIERLQLALSKSETACGHLEADLAEIHDQQRRVMDESCGDERHCTCVPILRREIERLKRYESECDAASNLLTAHVGHGVGLLQVAAGFEAVIADLVECRRLLREAVAMRLRVDGLPEEWFEQAEKAGGEHE